MRKKVLACILLSILLINSLVTPIAYSLDNVVPNPDEVTQVEPKASDDSSEEEDTTAEKLDVSLTPENQEESSDDSKVTEEGDNGEYYSYFVEEAPVSGYTAIYSNSNTSSETPSEVTATSDTITITNKANKQYALPKTGGSFVQSFVIAGLTISGLAALLLLLKSYKNQEGNVL